MVRIWHMVEGAAFAVGIVALGAITALALYQSFKIVMLWIG